MSGREVSGSVFLGDLEGNCPGRVFFLGGVCPGENCPGEAGELSVGEIVRGGFYRSPRAPRSFYLGVDLI